MKKICKLKKTALRVSVIMITFAHAILCHGFAYEQINCSTEALPLPR